VGVEQRILQIVQLTAIAVIAVSCYLVLRPFFSAILFALVVCISTWPIYLRLRKLVRERSSLAALLMIVLLMLVVIVPTALLAASLVDNVTTMVNTTKTFLENGTDSPPVWFNQIPLLGAWLTDFWRELVSGGKEAVTMLMELLVPTRKLLLVVARAIGHSVLHMVFAAFILFFLYRDGDALIEMLRNGVAKLAGSLGEKLLITIHRTIAGVVQGIFGAALAQAIVATVGFLIAGVPGALLLGAATFILSMIPIGPPMVWGAASVWLYYQGSYGWTIFMILWGVIGISSIDNIVKPYIISQGSELSLLLAVLGVFGGIIAFGFIGIFIGPPVLAVGLTLVKLWTVYPSTKTTRQLPR